MVASRALHMNLTRIQTLAPDISVARPYYAEPLKPAKVTDPFRSGAHGGSRFPQ